MRSSQQDQEKRRRHKAVGKRRVWHGVPRAARHLGISDPHLRRMIEQHTQLGADDVEYAEFDGIVARKFGSRWKVYLGKGWTEPEPEVSESKQVGKAPEGTHE